MGFDEPRAEFEQMLAQMIERPEDEQQVTDRIYERFGRSAALLVLDMCGFSRISQTCGILPFLLMIREMQRLAGPVVESEGGTIFKAEADNLFCLFADVPQAVSAGERLLVGLESASRTLPDDRCMAGSIGIGFGRILHVGDNVFGSEFNLTCKLGEDIADRGEILLTAAAAERLHPPRRGDELESTPLSNLLVRFFRYRSPTPRLAA